VPEHIVERAEITQSVKQPGIADIDFWRFDETLPLVASPWRQPPDEQQIGHRVETVHNAVPVGIETMSKALRIEVAALAMRDHRPETLERLGMNSKISFGIAQALAICRAFQI